MERGPQTGRSQTLRRKRLGENERDYVAVLGLDGDELDALCECGRATCFGTVRVTKAMYRSIRAHPGYFVVLRGHEYETDTIVFRTTAFLIVEPNS